MAVFYVQLDFASTLLSLDPVQLLVQLPALNRVRCGVHA